MATADEKIAKRKQAGQQLVDALIATAGVLFCYVLPVGLLALGGFCLWLPVDIARSQGWGQGLAALTLLGLCTALVWGVTFHGWREGVFFPVKDDPEPPAPEKIAPWENSSE